MQTQLLLMVLEHHFLIYLCKWAQMYQEATGNKLNYQSIGSGGGVKQIKAKTVDFGASDAPLFEQLKKPV